MSKHEDESSSLSVPNNQIGRIYGKGHGMIKQLEERTNCQIRILKYPSTNPLYKTHEQVFVFGEKSNDCILLIKRILDGKRLLPKFELEIKLKQGTRVYFDLLNFADSHFFDDPSDWSFIRVLNKVKNLLQASKNEGIEIISFVDSLRKEEALEKWEKRMIYNVTDGIRGVPQNISGTLSEMFQKYGGEVRFSTQAKNDDTIAAHAFLDKQAVILSGDRDFLRYYHDDNNTERNKEDVKTIKFELYENFQVDSQQNTIRFMSRRQEDDKLLQRPPPPPLKLILPPPKYTLIAEDGWIESIKKNKLFRGGAPSPLVRKLNFNPYCRILPLRRALYEKIFDENEKKEKEIKIMEEFPVWNENKNQVEFIKEEIILSTVINEEMNKLLQEPMLAFKHFFPIEFANRNKPPPFDDVTPQNWYRHVHGCKVITVEVCVCSPENHFSFLDIMIESETW